MLAKALMSKYVSKGARPEYYHFSQSGWAFAKEHSEYQQGWVEFHRRHAKLRSLCANCHSEVTRLARRQGESVVLPLESLEYDAACIGRDSSEESQ